MQLRWYQGIVLALYRALFTLVLLVFIVLFPFWIFTTKRRKTLFKRLGWQDYPHARQSSDKPVWIHALSIGELLSAGNLIEQVRRAIGDRPLYLSVSTLSAFTIATERFTRFCDGLFYFPYDMAFSVTRGLNKINPALLVRTGFHRLRRTVTQQSDLPDIVYIEPYDPGRAFESLCVECYKP